MSDRARERTAGPGRDNVPDLAYELDPARAASLGLVVLQADETIEQDFRRLLPADAELLVSRVPSGLEVTRETLGEMENHIAQAAGLFPRAARFDCVGYACTSGTSVIGAPRVGELLREGTQTRSVSEPVSAAIAACRHLGITRLAFLSPYVAEVSLDVRNAIGAAGIEIAGFASFNVAEEARVVRISRASVIAGAIATLDLDRDAEAVFLSCTNLRTLDVLAEIEAKTGRIALSSNQAMAWHMMKLAGIDHRPAGFGKLFER